MQPTLTGPYLAFLCEAVDHAQDEARPKYVQQLQQHQQRVEEVIAKEGTRVGDGLIVRGIEDPEAGRRVRGLHQLL